jgi:hypothetical protein
MRAHIPAAGAGAAAVLLALTSCATASTQEMTSANAQTAMPTTQCHGAYVADVDTSVPGEATPETAAIAWSKSVAAPSGAPTSGWKATDELTQQSGDWIIGVSQTVPGGWVVSGLGCGPS